MQNNLKQRRKKRKMTQKQLASASGISRQTISLIENNQLDNIESNTMIKLAKALNYLVSDIFFTDDVKRTQQNNINAFAEELRSD